MDERMLRLADGGIVSSATLFHAGDGAEELIIPLSSYQTGYDTSTVDDQSVFRLFGVNEQMLETIQCNEKLNEFLRFNGSIIEIEPTPDGWRQFEKVKRGSTNET